MSKGYYKNPAVYIHGSLSDKFDQTIHIDCVHCGVSVSFPVNGADFSRWERGEALIQEAMPYLTAGQRELLISGTCDTCWDRLFYFEDGQVGFIEDDEELEI